MDTFKSVIREFKVLRDIWQFAYVALYSMVDYMEREVKIALSIIPDIISLNIPASIYESIAVLIIVLVVIVAIILIIVGYIIEPRMKLLVESPSWNSISKGKRRLIAFSLLIYTTELQSVNNAVLSFLFFTKSADSNSAQCGQKPNGFIQFIGVLIVLLLDGVILYILFKRIKRDRPVIKGKSYNNQKYALDLETVQTPYKTLFEEYSYKLAYYEIVIIFVKIFSIFLMVGVSLQNQECDLNPDKKVVVGSAAIMNANLILLVLEVFKFSFYYFSRPYLNLSSNRRMAFGCVMNAILYFININITWPTTNTGETNQLGVGLAVNFWICNFFLGLIWIFTSESKIQGNSGTANVYKKLTKKLDMTPITMRNIDDKASDVIENYVMFNDASLDLDREKQLIFWQPWWDQFFEEYATKKNKKTKCCGCFTKKSSNFEATDLLTTSSYDILYLPDCPPVFRPKKIDDGINKKKSMHTLHERFVENSHLLNFLDSEDYQRALVMRTNKAELIEKIVSFIGPDVFSEGKFHQMTVIPFPFTILLVLDGSNSSDFKIINFLEQDDMHKLIQENVTEEAKKIKEVRKKIRCLEGQNCHWHSVEEKRVLNVKKRQFELLKFNFEEGTLIINRDIDSHPIYGPNSFNIGPGFRCHLVYKKAYTLDSSGNRHSQKKTIPGSEFGILFPFNTTPLLDQFFEKNSQLINENLPKYKEKLSIYRENFKFVYFEDKANVLSYEFTFKIYNDMSLSKNDLKELFLREKNIDIKKIGEDMERNQQINSLYDFLGQMSKSMPQCWWILFWHDLWNLNKYFKGYAKPAKLSTKSKFNVYNNNNIAQEYDHFKESANLTNLIVQERKMDYFKKRKLFENIFKMLERIKSKEEILQKIMALSPEDRKLIQMDDENDLETGGYSKNYSPKSNRFKSKGKKNSRKSPTRTLDNESLGNSPFNTIKIQELKTDILNIQRSEIRSPSEGQNLISKDDHIREELKSPTEGENLMSKEDPIGEDYIENLIKEDDNLDKLAEELKNKEKENQDDLDKLVEEFQEEKKE